jgi:hypothetical protein
VEKFGSDDVRPDFGWNEALTMNIERARGVGHGRLYSGISNTKTLLY